MDLHGKVAIVTGASSGIGEATARHLAGHGMRVVAVARRTERLERLAAEQPRILPHTADVTVDADVQALAARVADELGACHVLVNNAGGARGSRFRGVEDQAVVEATMDLNFGGTVRCMGAFAGLLVDSAPARVVNIGSIAGKVAVGSPAYAAAKFATIGFTEAVRADWAKRGVLVSQVNPGFISTEGFPQTALLRSPLRRLVGEPHDVAVAVAKVARTGAPERTVPRWYRPVTVLRHVAPPVFRAGSKAMG